MEHLSSLVEVVLLEDLFDERVVFAVVESGLVRNRIVILILKIYGRSGEVLRERSQYSESGGAECLCIDRDDIVIACDIGCVKIVILA